MIKYKGRFAPSPTGPLHFGSLIAATASFLEASVNKGEWIIRIEDLDKPREIAGATNSILHMLEAFGFEWNNDILYQSQRDAAYQVALMSLQSRNLVYPCICSRKEIADSATSLGVEGLIYPGTCKNGLIKSHTDLAYRLSVQHKTIEFNDAILGRVIHNLATDIGDFVLKRADGLFAYQLAVVVDDAMENITHVVRGADLLNSTPRQIYLQQLLGLNTPHYAHIPIATNIQGKKLSKQTLAQAIDAKHANHLIWQALNFLGQSPPIALQNESLNHVWGWAKQHWNLQNVPKQRAIIVHPLP